MWALEKSTGFNWLKICFHPAFRILYKIKYFIIIPAIHSPFTSNIKDMQPILSIDIGAGTTDILVFYPDTYEHYKAVAVSPVRKIAKTIQGAGSDLLLSGTIMGGGAVSNAIIQHAKTHKVFITRRAAKTINDDLKKVRAKGVTIVSEEEKEKLSVTAITHIILRDMFPSGIRALLHELGVAWKFSYLAAAVQDHGVAPRGVSSIDFRHQIMKTIIDEKPVPEAFLFRVEEIPPYLTRMKATGALLSEIPHQKAFMMDTGMAAVIGASLDPNIQGCSHCLVVDIGNSHTLGACLSNGLIGGFFEYHTNHLTPQRIEELLVNLGNGTLEHSCVVSEGGHGAYIRSCPGFNKIEKIVVTGPRRYEIMRGVNLEYKEGGPLGDTMMTGTAGLIEAIKRNENLNITF